MQEEQIDPEFEKLKNSKFKQQKLPAWRPVPTITSTTLTFLFFGVAFIVIGIVVLVYSNQIVEFSQRYDDTCGTQETCTVTIDVKEKLEPPIMVYYQLNNFYQNHRRYVKSKSNSQLQGQNMTVDQLKSDCDPIVTVKDLGINKTVSGKILDDSAPANPCGLIAKSLFNDTYTLYDPNKKKIEINETGIAWEADRRLKYGQSSDWQDHSWTNVTNEHFMVWMRPAGLPDFRKLWGRINQVLDVGTYQLEIQNHYNVKPFNGSKLFVGSTVNGFGGKNSFLGISYLVVGSICIIMAIVFVIGYKMHNQKKEN